MNEYYFRPETGGWFKGLTADKVIKSNPPKSQKFWMVKRMGAGAASVMHPSFDEAAKEAARLAKLHPGEVFVVLQATHRFCAETPVSITEIL